MYTRVATSPEGAFHSHRGPDYAAARLGYSAAALAALPEEVTAAFGGIGNPLRIASLGKGTTVTPSAMRTLSPTFSPLPTHTATATLTSTATFTPVPPSSVTTAPTATLKPGGGGGGCVITSTNSSSAGWWMLVYALLSGSPATNQARELTRRAEQGDGRAMPANETSEEGAMTRSRFLQAGAATTILCVALLVASARPAQAGGNLWASHGSDGGVDPARPIDPIESRRVYAVMNGGGMFAIDQGSACVGDCDGKATVTVDELVKGVNIALGLAAVVDCPSFDIDQSTTVTVDELVQAVNAVLNGCVPDSACDDHNPCTVDRFISGGTCRNTLSVLPCTNGPAAVPMYVGVWTDDAAERRIVRNQDVDALRATWESQSAAGFRLIGVAGRESSPGLVTFDSLFKASDDPAYGLSVTTDRAAFDAEVASLGEQGKQLVHFETVTGSGPQWYVGVWLGAGSSALVIDLSLEQLRAERTNRSAAGMRLVDIETYEVGGSRLYAGVFNEGSGPDDLQVGLSWDAFAAVFEQNGALHLVDVETWEDNGRRLYAGVWNGVTGGSERLVGGHDWAAFSAENAGFEQKGKKLVDLDLFSGLPAPPAIFSAKIYEHLGTMAVGYSYALAKDGTVIGYGAQGYKRAPWERVGGGLPMTPDTRIHLASVSKTITATAFMTLGVSADDNFYPYIQQRFPIHGQGVDQVKIADLLTHKSGISQVLNGTCGALQGFTFDAFVGFLLSQPLVGTPGVDYEYNNNNSCVVRAVIEAIAGQDYVSYVNAHVFVPFGVFDTTAYQDPIDPVLYYGVSEGAVDQSPGVLLTQDFTSFAGGCCWYGSAIDMIRFLNGIRTFAVLTPQLTDEMFNRGFGWFPVDTAAGTAFWHGGLGTYGVYRGSHTLVGHLPEGYDATVLINTVDLNYVNVVDTGPLSIFPLPAIDAVVDAFNSYWNEIQ